MFLLGWVMFHYMHILQESLTCRSRNTWAFHNKVKMSAGKKSCGIIFQCQIPTIIPHFDVNVLTYCSLKYWKMFCVSYRSAFCFLGVFLISKNRKRTKTFEPYVTMDMVNGLYKLYVTLNLLHILCKTNQVFNMQFLAWILPVLSIIRCPDHSWQGPICSARLQRYFLLRGPGQQRRGGSCDSTSWPGAAASRLNAHRSTFWPPWPERRLKFLNLNC